MTLKMPHTTKKTSEHRLLAVLVALLLAVTGAAQTEEGSVRMEGTGTYSAFADGRSFTVHLALLRPDEWCHPLKGSRVLSPFGNRGERRHTGTDLKTTAHDTIRAAFDGVVTQQGPFSGYGNCVVVRHSLGFETLYSHNSRNLVRRGQQVRAGQPVAIVGRTGRATTEHLHFEVRVDGRPYNSELIFDHATSQLRRHSVTFRKSGQATISAKP